jgi:hypothetical protein
MTAKVWKSINGLSLSWAILISIALIIILTFTFLGVIINPLFYLGFISLIVLGIIWFIMCDDFSFEPIYEYSFYNFDTPFWPKKIIKIGNTYYRAVLFMGVYIQETFGYNTEKELLEANQKKEKQKEEELCEVIGNMPKGTL